MLLLWGVTIGDGAIIKSNSYVCENIPPYAIVEGNPAKVIGFRFCDDYIHALQEIQWWNWSDKELRERKVDFSLGIREFVEKYKK